MKPILIPGGAAYRGLIPARLTIQEILYKYLPDEYTNKRELVGRHYPEKYIDAETGGRKLRNLVEEGKAEVKYIGGLAYYRKKHE